MGFLINTKIKADTKLTVVMWCQIYNYRGQTRYERVKPVSPRALSLVGKTSHCKQKTLTTPKFGPKKIVSVIAFRIA